ncbi:MAG: AzlD domain-containing protein [Clostridiales bacterium]|nr:AzlD domain-containing protein [Clostridiales bacterium]
MTQSGIYIAILVAAAVSFLVRTLPLTLIRKKITNRFLRSFLHYVPYVTLAVMTFPAIVDAAENPVAGIAALVTGAVMAWFNAGLFPVAVVCCVVVYTVGLIG